MALGMMQGTMRPAAGMPHCIQQQQHLVPSARASSLQGLQLTAHSRQQRQREGSFRYRQCCLRVAAAATMAPAKQAQAAKKPTDTKPTVIVTGASSGLGLAATKELARSGDWHVVMACRDYPKAVKAARDANLPEGSWSVQHLDLASLDSVRTFVEAFRSSGRPLDVLVCNAAVYLPTAKEPSFTAEGFEMSVGTNHLGHFLLANLLLEDLEHRAQAKQQGKPRLILVGSVTGNTNTMAGNVPPKADLGELRGLYAALDNPQSGTMIDGGEFDGAKAYKDSKVGQMMTMREMHRRFHNSTGVSFASLYPGCIADTALFRNHVPVFRTLFPLFQKYITKGYVSQEDAGKRLAQVVSDPKLEKSGVYWSWNDNSNSFENDVSGEVADDAKATKLFELSQKLVGLAK